MSCNKCSIKSGLTLWRNATVQKYIDPSDEYVNHTCPAIEQCVEQHFGDYLLPNTFGCCKPCGVHQLCYEGSIARLPIFAESNICPDGYLCDPVNLTTKCPEGTICSDNLIMNCSEAIEKSLFHEILEGTYCAEGSAVLELCPTGYYCPNPGEKHLCPPGYFCMQKSKEVWLECVGCKEGALALQRNEWQIIVTYVIVCVILVFLIISRILGIRPTKNALVASIYQKTDLTLSKIRKRLETRVNDFDFEQELSESVRELSFDEFDLDGMGYITYDDVQKMLSLSPVKMERLKYCLSMNSEYSEERMSRDFFDDHFSLALFKAKQVDPTEDEVMQLFDKLDKDGSGILTGNELYNSYLTLFLDDGEINELIKQIGTKIPKKQFVEQYPSALSRVISQKTFRQMEIVFRNLTLTVGDSKTVVNHVSGKMEAKKMTACMGGSGSGKTSLLNALCGRAYYGKVTGQVFFNGHEGVFNDVKQFIGFVPQDDIVYAELTVLENFLYAGRFRLPRNTPGQDISDLADQVVADLGLVRVKDSIVGDVTRRGVSGGEKKRVNIGLELMGRPLALFLDEPTSGLDSSSSLHVMSSLKLLTHKQKMTICAVIHQPRKFIFDQFDNVVLLAAGGKIVYFGPTGEIEQYFTNLGYQIPHGENIADFIIDVSTGALSRPTSERILNYSIIGKSLKHMPSLDEIWKRREESLTKEVPAIEDLPSASSMPSGISQTWLQIKRRTVVISQNKRNHLIDFFSLLFGMLMAALISGVLVPVSTSGSRSLSPQILNFDELYESLIFPIDNNFLSEFFVPSLCRYYRNPDSAENLVQNMVSYSLEAEPDISMYALISGLIVSVLVSISASKPLSQKRLEFFRESGSGYSISAFFIALSSITIVEQTVAILICSLLARMRRQTMVSIWHFCVNFILLSFNSTAWGFFYATWVSPSNLVTLIGFHMVASLILSGATPQLPMKQINASPALNVIASIFSPVRLFIESYTVTEQKCLKEQSGFTSKTLYIFNLTNFEKLGYGVHDPNVTIRSCSGWTWNFLPMFLVGSTVFFTAGVMLHISNRHMMMKSPFIYSFKQRRFLIRFSTTFVVWAGVFAVTVWSIVAQRGKLSEELPSLQNTHCSLCSNVTVQELCLGFKPDADDIFTLSN